MWSSVKNAHLFSTESVFSPSHRLTMTFCMSWDSMMNSLLWVLRLAIVDQMIADLLSHWEHFRCRCPADVVWSANEDTRRLDCAAASTILVLIGADDCCLVSVVYHKWNHSLA